MCVSVCVFDLVITVVSQLVSHAMTGLSPVITTPIIKFVLSDC